MSQRENVNPRREQNHRKNSRRYQKKSGSEKAAQHDFYHGDRVAAYSCGGSFFCVKIKQN